MSLLQEDWHSCLHLVALEHTSSLGAAQIAAYDILIESTTVAQLVVINVSHNAGGLQLFLAHVEHPTAPQRATFMQAAQNMNKTRNTNKNLLNKNVYAHNDTEFCWKCNRCIVPPKGMMH